MYFWVLLFVVLVVVWVIRRLKHSAKWDHFPGHRSHTSLPLIGHSYLFGTTPLECLNENREKYGDIFRLDFGNFPTVWLCDYDDVSDTFKQDIFTDRPHHLMPAMGMSRGVDSRGYLSGPLFSNGQAWVEQRKFMFQNMSNLGMGKKDTMEDIISQEVSILCETLAKRIKEGDNPVTINHVFMTAVNNVVWRMVTGKRSKQSDPEMVVLTKNVWDFFRVLERGSILQVLQLNSYWVTKLSQWFSVENMVDICKPMLEMFRREVKQSVADADGNYFDRFLYEISKADRNSTFHGDDGSIHLIGSVFDIFAAGTDTVSTFLEWSVHYMISYPDVQERVSREIDEVIGDRPATLADRTNTHYTEATIDEMMRHSPHMALTLSHFVTQDTHFKGYFFPKGTQVYSYPGGIHKTKKTFKDPQIFRPERFLDKDGTFRSDEHVVYFGIGKRRCVGEILARAETYLFFVGLVQAFKFKAPGGVKPEFKYLPGLNMHPVHFKALMEPKY